MELKKMDPKVSDKVVELRLKELEIKSKEIELKNKLTETNLEFATQSLKIQSEDYKEHRRKETTREKLVIFSVTFTILLFFAFTTAAMLLNKDDLLADIVKSIAFVFSGGITGYGIGLQKGKK